MKRSKAIRLVLIGGGVAAMLAACGDRRDLAAECARAKAEMRVDAEEICRRSQSAASSRGSSFVGSGWTRGRTATDTRATAPATSSRGGFGSTASSSSRSSGS
jgi:hypothetical protein